MPNEQPDYRAMYLKLMYHMVEIEEIAKKALAQCDENANGTQFKYEDMKLCGGKTGE